MGGCWGPDRRERLRNKAEIALVTDPDRGREWECMGGCWGPVRNTKKAHTFTLASHLMVLTLTVFILCVCVCLAGSRGAILRDSAYPQRHYLMVPFKANKERTEPQRHYNVAHRKQRVVIEQTFGLLKARYMFYFFTQQLCLFSVSNLHATNFRQQLQTSTDGIVLVPQHRLTQRNILQVKRDNCFQIWHAEAHNYTCETHG